MQFYEIVIDLISYLSYIYMYHVYRVYIKYIMIQTWPDLTDGPIWSNLPFHHFAQIQKILDPNTKKILDPNTNKILHPTTSSGPPPPPPPPNYEIVSSSTFHWFDFVIVLPMRMALLWMYLGMHQQILYLYVDKR